MTYSTSYQDVSLALAKALGMDGKNIAWFELRVAVDEIVSVKVCRFVEASEIDELKTVVEKYDLVRREPPAGGAVI